MFPQKPLKLVSYLAPNWYWFYTAIAAYLERVLAIETQLIQAVNDPLADPALLQDELDLAFICGLPFTRYCQAVPGQLQLLAAPVMRASRYQNRPVYFADVVVSAVSGLKTFANLAGKTVCYNDPGSNSGYNLLRYRLLQGDCPEPFFKQAIQSGSHQRSLRWVAEGIADCAAIDSTVLEQEVQSFPELAQRLQVIESIGPCSMPPLVAARHLDATLISQIQTALLLPDAELQIAMQQAGVSHYARVELADYAAIAHIYDLVSSHLSFEF
jgi:phosphonate transport system substrate-binding protein